MTDRSRLALRWALRLLGPVLLALVLWRLPEPRRVLELFAQANGWLLLASFAVNIVAIQLKVTRWQVMLRARAIHYATKDAWLAFTASLYLAMLTPGRVGDVLRVQYLRHDRDVPYAEGLASVVMDRLCDLYVLAGFVAIAIVHYSGIVSNDLRLASWAVVAVTVVAPLGLLVPGVARRLLGRIYRRFSGEDQGLESFLSALSAQLGKTLVWTLPLTVIAFLVSFGQSWLIARALGLNLAYFDVICLTAVANLAGLLPISISGVGVREAFFTAVFPALGYAPEQAVSFGLMVFLVIYLSLAGVGFIAWQIRPPPFHRSERVSLS